MHPDVGTVWDRKAIGIPFVVVGDGQDRVEVSFTYGTESDPGPYPIPSDAPIEDGSDDAATRCRPGPLTGAADTATDG